MNEQMMAGAQAPPAERRQITVVFMDIAGFSAIASTTEPEDLQHWLESFYAQAHRVIEAHHGVVTEYLGDGIVALFGLDHADELAASRAVNAAMAALRDVDVSQGPGGRAQLRIGVATGDAAVRAQEAGDSRPRAIGMVTTLAQRIQERATPGTVMISEGTQALLRGDLRTEPVADQKLKGFAEAQTLFRPLAGPVMQGAKTPPFVGRTGVLRRISQSPDAALLVGPAGIGKTAIARHLASQAAQATTFTADGVYTRASYQPFIRWIQAKTGSELPGYGDLGQFFATLAEPARQALALILGLPEGQQLLAERSNVALKALIEESLWGAIQTTQNDGLLVFEDLHWLDNASFGVLTHIIQSDAAARYRLVLTSREDTKIGKFLGPLPVRIIPLEPLSEIEATALLHAISDGRATDSDRANVIPHAGGIPLFIEQTYKRDAARSGSRRDVPGSLKDLLAQQIDATKAAKPLLQAASAIGPRFDLETLRAITPPDDQIAEHLDLARRQGVLKQTGSSSWAFAHALLQQAAYQSMVRQTRVDYHAAIAAHLQSHHADAIVRNPALLTEHLSLAQQHVPAIQNYLAISRWALFQGAFEDAEAHVLAAITLCHEAPDAIDVRPLEIACHTALGSIRMQIQGFTAAPVKAAFDKVLALAADQNAHSAVNGPAFYGSFTHAVLSADKPKSVQFSDMLRATAKAITDGDQGAELRLASLNVDTALHFYAGDFAKTTNALDGLRETYDIARHGGMITSHGADTYAAAQMFECVSRAIRGDTHLVAEMIDETDAHQARLNIPVMQPWALIWGAVPLHYAGMTDAALARVRRGLATATSQTAAFWQVTGTAWLNVMDPSESLGAEGLADFHTVIKTHEAMGANIGLPYFRAHYAMALARNAQVDDAYQASLRAVRENEANGLLCWYAEVLRLHARVCAMRGGTAGAARFRKEAAAVAIRQDALLWLLRVRLDQFRAEEVGQKPLRDVLNRLHPDATLPEVQAARQLLGHR